MNRGFVCYLSVSHGLEACSRNKTFSRKLFFAENDQNFPPEGAETLFLGSIDPLPFLQLLIISNSR